MPAQFGLEFTNGDLGVIQPGLKVVFDVFGRPDGVRMSEMISKNRPQQRSTEGQRGALLVG